MKKLILFLFLFISFVGYSQSTTTTTTCDTCVIQHVGLKIRPAAEKQGERISPADVKLSFEKMDAKFNSKIGSVQGILSTKASSTELSNLNTQLRSDLATKSALLDTANTLRGLLTASNSPVADSSVKSMIHYAFGASGNYSDINISSIFTPSVMSEGWHYVKFHCADLTSTTLNLNPTVKITGLPLSRYFPATNTYQDVVSIGGVSVGDGSWLGVKIKNGAIVASSNPVFATGMYDKWWISKKLNTADTLKLSERINAKIDKSYDVNSDGTVETMLQKGSNTEGFDAFGVNGSYGQLSVFNGVYYEGGDMPRASIEFKNNTSNYMSSVGVSNTVNIASDSAVFVNSKSGIQYAEDFSSSYTPRSLVDKLYVDTKVLTTSESIAGVEDDVQNFDCQKAIIKTFVVSDIIGGLISINFINVPQNGIVKLRFKNAVNGDFVNFFGGKVKNIDGTNLSSINLNGVEAITLHSENGVLYYTAPPAAPPVTYFQQISAPISNNTITTGFSETSIYVPANAEIIDTKTVFTSDPSVSQVGKEIVYEVYYNSVNVSTGSFTASSANAITWGANIPPVSSSPRTITIKVTSSTFTAGARFTLFYKIKE